MTRQAGRAVASQYLGVAMTATAVEESLYIPPTLSLASGWGDEDHADDRSVFARYDIGEPATVFSLTGNREVRLTREPPIVTFDPMRAYGWGRLRFGGRGFVILHAPLALSDTPHWLAARVDRELTDEGTGLGGEEVAVAGEDMVRFGTQGGGTETTSWATGFPRTGSVPPYYDTLEVIAAVTSSGALLFPNAAVASRYLEDARREPLALHLITEHRARELVLAPIDAATGERRRVLIADAGAEAFALAVPQARVEYLAEMIVGATQGPEERAIVRLLMAIPGEGEPAATLAALQTAEPELYAQLFTDLGSNLWELAVQVGERRAGAPGSTGGLGQVLAGLVTQLLLQRFDPDGVALGDSGLTLRIRSGLVDRPGELPVVLPDTVNQLWTAAETAVERDRRPDRGGAGESLRDAAGDPPGHRARLDGGGGDRSLAAGLGRDARGGVARARRGRTDDRGDRRARRDGPRGDRVPRRRSGPRPPAALPGALGDPARDRQPRDRGRGGSRHRLRGGVPGPDRTGPGDMSAANVGLARRIAKALARSLPRRGEQGVLRLLARLEPAEQRALLRALENLPDDEIAKGLRVALKRRPDLRGARNAFLILEELSTHLGSPPRSR